MLRVDQFEILDTPEIPDECAGKTYRELARIHRWLGDTRCIRRAIAADPLPVRRILDVGCATGVVLERLQSKLRVEAIGVDLYPRPAVSASVPILRADAVRDALPRADVAYSMYLGHHLNEIDLASLIQNVGRFCRRFILLDLVRHPLPLAFFRVALAPLCGPIVAVDGERSIRRSYTVSELRRVAEVALAGTGATFRHRVAPFWARQVIDVAYG
jgi:SAM-dependent methyltransferase